MIKIINEDYRYSFTIPIIVDVLKDYVKPEVKIDSTPDYVQLSYQKTPKSSMVRGSLEINQSALNTVLKYSTPTSRSYKILASTPDAPEDMSEDELREFIIKGITSKYFPKTFLR